MRNIYICTVKSANCNNICTLEGAFNKWDMNITLVNLKFYYSIGQLRENLVLIWISDILIIMYNLNTFQANLFIWNLVEIFISFIINA